MPLGDSITLGQGAAGGYRNKLHQLLTTAGYNVDFVGTQNGNGVVTLPDPDHQGHSGWRIDQIDANVAGWFGVLPDPDVILLHIGTNDFGQSFDTINAINRLDALITKLATERPYAHIIVTNLLERNEPQNAAIQAEFNPLVPGIVTAQAALGRRVTFLDMRSAVPLADMPDQLHPNQTGYDKMADAWSPAVQAVIGPDGDIFPPAIVRAVGSADRTGVAITFSKPVADAAAAVGNYSINGGLTVSAAVLDAGKRVVTLTTSEQAVGLTYTVTVNGVVDRTAGMLALPANSTVDFESATPRGYLENVPESAGYTLAYSLDIPSEASYKTVEPDYAVDNTAFIGPYGRVAYYLELQDAIGALQFVWASMDAFTSNAGQIAVPTTASGAIFQQAVTNLNVVSNVAGVSPGTGLSGNIEFWPTNYAQANAAAVPGADGSTFDFGDEQVLGGCYGSMQVHNTGAGQTVFGFNNWGDSGGVGDADLGIGNDPAPVGGGLDWTFHHNAGSYVVKTLQVLVQTTGDSTPPTLVSAVSFGGNRVAVRFSEPIAAGSVEAGDFTLDGGITVLGVTVGANQRDVVLLTSAQPAGAHMNVTVSGITDSSPAANAIVAGSAIVAFAPLTTAGIVKLRVGDILPGSESVTLVTNGGFEDASSGNNFLPAGWNRFGNMFYDFHGGIPVPPSMGVHSARIHIDGGSVGNYNQDVALTPNTDYILSGYLWHLGDATHTGTVELDLNDESYEPDDGGGSISITQDDLDANKGYFVYGLFNPGNDNSATLRAFMVFSGNTGWPNQPTGALWDNIAITPADAFVPPALVNAPFEMTDFVYDRIGDTFTLTWGSEPGRSYAVQYSPDLWDWSTTVAPAVIPAGASTTFGPFANPAPGAVRGFVRVRRN